MSCDAGRMPFGLEPRRPGRRAVTGIDAKTGYPNQVVAAEHQRQAVAPPGRHPGFLEQILQRAPWSPRIRLQPLASAAQTQVDRLALEPGKRDPRAPHASAARFAAGQPSAPTRPRRARARGAPRATRRGTYAGPRRRATIRRAPRAP